MGHAPLYSHAHFVHAAPPAVHWDSRGSPGRKLSQATSWGRHASDRLPPMGDADLWAVQAVNRIGLGMCALSNGGIPSRSVGIASGPRMQEMWAGHLKAQQILRRPRMRWNQANGRHVSIWRARARSP